jgi:hypothetical protein
MLVHKVQSLKMLWLKIYHDSKDGFVLLNHDPQEEQAILFSTPP